jgi:hypothetical protein
MYPLHLYTLANGPRVSLRALGSPLLTCPLSKYLLFPGTLQQVGFLLVVPLGDTSK